MTVHASDFYFAECYSRLCKSTQSPYFSSKGPESQKVLNSQVCISYVVVGSSALMPLTTLKL